MSGTALVVGASRGIGAQIAIDLARKGFCVGCIARTESALKSVVRQCIEAYTGPTANLPGVIGTYATADITDRKAQAAAIKQCLASLGCEHTGLQTLVFCAGIEGFQSIAAPPSDIPKNSGPVQKGRLFKGGLVRSIIETNFMACCESVYQALPAVLVGARRFKQHKANASGATAPVSSSVPSADSSGTPTVGQQRPYPSSIIIISSAAVYADAIPGMGAYYASKHALHGYAHALFQEVRHMGVKVSLICPGLVNTKMGSDIVDANELVQGTLNKAIDIAPRDMIQSRDVSEAVVYAATRSANCCPTEIHITHNALLTGLLLPLLQIPKVPQPPPACQYPVSKPLREVAIVAGASRGIGRGIALDLAREGFTLVLIARNASTLSAVAKEARQLYGVEVHCEAMDVSDIEAVERTVHNTVARFGGLSTLVFNAALNRRKTSLASNRKVWDKVMDVNLRSAMHITRTSLPYMHQVAEARKMARDKLPDASERTIRNPSIVYLGTEGAFRMGTGLAGIAPYITSKRGLFGLAMVVYEDVRTAGIKVSYVAPGLTATDLGMRPGPAEWLKPDQMLSVDDVVEAVNYVINSAPRVCPTLVRLNPTPQPFPQFGILARRLMDSTAVSKL